MSEIVTGLEINTVQSGPGEFINPSGSIRRLEENLRFSNTFSNRIAWADAYLAAGESDKAISLFEQSLKGAFDENEYVLSQLVVAYDQKRMFTQVVSAAKKIKHLPQFKYSHFHILYANALAQTGSIEKAEAEFITMNDKFSLYVGITLRSFHLLNNCFCTLFPEQ